MSELDFLLNTLELKDETRRGWELRGVEHPESVADHSWGTAFLCLLYGEDEEVDAAHSAKIGMIHDIAEVVTGDVARRANPEKDKQKMSDEAKKREEGQAMEKLLSLADGAGIDADIVAELWREYEEGETEEAVFARDMNLIDLCLQALFYEENHRYDPGEENDAFEEYEHMDEFFATTEPRLSTDTGKELFKKTHARYEEAKA